MDTMTYTLADLPALFELRHRDNGESFWALKDEHPDWLYDACREAHGDELPDDWRWETCARIVRYFDEQDRYDALDEDSPGQAAEALADVYTSSLMRWLADDVNRPALVDEHRDEGLISKDAGIVQTVQATQWLEIERMATILLDAILENIES